MNFKLIFLFFLFSAEVLAQPRWLKNPERELKAYQENLSLLRQQNSLRRSLPDFNFFLFGMGNREKLIYKKGQLKNALTGKILREWKVKKEIIVPSQYLVHIETVEGGIIQIMEDEAGVWELSETHKPALYSVTSASIKLPDFAGKKFNRVMKVLHHEILINIVESKPVPNFFVYKNPWFRDAALMAMVLKTTGNLSVIEPWIKAIRDPFDRNNHGISEADNLGQVLYLVSLVGDKKHPVVSIIMDSVKQFERHDGSEVFLEGKTDYSLHPVFQTKWMKYGLKCLKLPDPYTIPDKYDSYSSLFWWDFKTIHVAGNKFDDNLSTNYPYLVWAEDHFYGEQRGIIGDLAYPLSWEQNASDAAYEGMQIIDAHLVKDKLSYPHTWHAAEMFLLLNEI